MRDYALQHQIARQERCSGAPLIDLSSNRFLRAYWDSLLPYFNASEKFTPNMASIKTLEAIELLLAAGAGQCLFDLGEPHKIDLEHFMNRNFSFVSMAEFARLSGRKRQTLISNS